MLRKYLAATDTLLLRVRVPLERAAAADIVIVALYCDPRGPKRGQFNTRTAEGFLSLLPEA